MRNLIFLGSIELSENRTHHAAIIEWGNATSFSQVTLTNRKKREEENLEGICRRENHCL